MMIYVVNIAFHGMSNKSVLGEKTRALIMRWVNCALKLQGEN
jgi:hypothetical protein